ncbi:Rint-1 family protein [Mycena kentingensis (nom. inval.)]|nr:Rint-1 family protein [Mycena kentingensis (nom. inval.)]
MRPTSIQSAVIAVATLSGFWVARWLRRRRAASKILDNIQGPKSKSFMAGNMAEVFNHDAWDFHQDIARQYGGLIRINALLGERHIYVFDPKALHQIMVKEQGDVFEETDSVLKGTRVSFGEGLLSSTGEQHRKQRKMLNPVFSAAHLRAMVPIFFQVGKRLRDSLTLRVKNGTDEVDILLWMSRTALELVGQAGLGWTFDSLTTDEAPKYIKAFKQLGIATSKPSMAILALYVLPYVSEIGSPKFRRFMVNILPWKDLHLVRDVLDTLWATAVQIYQTKKAALEAGDEAVTTQISKGKDIISIMMKDNENASDSDRLSESEILGQLNVLVFAATDTTSSALSRALHLLSERQDIQDKLRAELKEALENEQELTYEQLTNLPYLDAITRETLRLYPPVASMNRVAKKDAVLTLMTPITLADGTVTTEVPIPAGTGIIISIINSNRNPELWGPDVLEWKPERWLEPLPDSVINAKIPGVYSHLMTFNGGGRSCIGFKFSQLEMKVVLSLLVSRFRVSLSDKKISWKMSNVAIPTLEGDKDSKPQMPIKLEIIE